jgi:hypothetical protein
MDLIERKGEVRKPERVIIELDAEDGKLLAEALDHAEASRRRVVEGRDNRGGQQNGSSLVSESEYGSRAAKIASWFGYNYVHEPHDLEDAVAAELEIQGQETRLVMDAIANFRRELDHISEQGQS